MTVLLHDSSLELEHKGAAIQFEKAHVTVGRDVHCEIVIKSIMIGRRHAEFVRMQDHWYVRNHSLNGTFVNGQRIADGELHQLTYGDCIVFANEEPFYFRSR